MYLEKYDLTGWNAIVTGGGCAAGLTGAADLKEKHGLAVLFLVANEASLMTDSIVLADGGYTAW